MSFTQIDLRAEFNHKHQAEFNSESWAMAEMYFSFLKSFEVGEVKKCIIHVSDNWSGGESDYTNWSDSKGINMPFDFIIYFKEESYSKKKMQLDVIHAGMMKIADIEGWKINPLLDAYNECISRGLEYSFQLDSQKSSKNRKYKIGLKCSWDIDRFQVFWQLFDKDGQLLKTEKFIDKEPELGEFIYYVKWKWIDDGKVLVEDKYEYGKKEKWEINVF
jgi:hypothetical protein